MCPLVKIDPLTFCSFIISVLSWRGKEIAVFFFFIRIALLFCFFAIYLFIVISSLLTRTCQSMILKLFLWHYHIVLTEESWHALSSQDPYAFTWFCPHGSHRLSWNIPLILTSLCCCNHFTLFHCKKKTKVLLTQTNVPPICLLGQTVLFIFPSALLMFLAFHVNWVVMPPQCDDIEPCVFKFFGLMSGRTSFSNRRFESAWRLFVKEMRHPL